MNRTGTPDPLDTPEIRALLDQLQSRIHAILGEKLVGLYLVGSLVVGDFEPAVSDIDLIALTTTELSPPEAAALEAMHAGVAAQYPRWDDRIEVIYVARDNINLRKPAHPIAVISPGEPFHVFEARGSDWLINWYVLYENGVALYGDDPRMVVTPVALDELLPSLKRQLAEFEQWVTPDLHRGGQAYAILTMCRALYTFRQRGFVSKPQAAGWAAVELPDWSSLILRALEWRLVPRDDVRYPPEATYPETLRFVRTVVGLSLSSPAS